MNLKQVQFEKLTDVLIEEGIKRGVNVSPVEVKEFLNTLFDSEYRAPGSPLTVATIQEPRAQFDMDAYNDFLDNVKLDSDTLLSFVKRARLESRNLLVYNDLVMKSFLERLNVLAEEVESFNEVTQPELTGMSIKTSKFKYSMRQPKYVYPEVDAELYLDSIHNSLELPLEGFLSRGLKLEDLPRSAVNIEVLADLGAIAARNEEASVLNIFSGDAQPFVYNVTMNGSLSTIQTRVTVDLPNLEDLNKLTLSPLQGTSSSITVEYASQGDNFIFLDRKENVTQPIAIQFALTTIKRVRLTYDLPAKEISNNQSFFTMGLTSLGLFRNVYKDSGSALFLGINPNINDHPILSVNMKVNGSFPNNTTSRYFVSINGSDPIPNTRISGDEDESVVEFSVAQKTEDPVAAVERELFRTRNGVDFYFLNFDNHDFDTSEDRTYIPKITELWDGQNSFIERPFPDVVTRNITDAIVRFGADNKQSVIQVPLEQDFMPLQTDDTGTYIELLLPLSYMSRTTTAVDLDTDVRELMKTEQHGLFKVTKYKSNDKESAEIVQNLTIDTNHPDRVYLSGTFEFDDSFSVSYLGNLDNKVRISNARLHNEYGSQGQDESNTIPLSSGRFQINFDTNQIFSTPGSGLSNTVKYIDFTGLFDFTKIRIYEAYIYIPQGVSSVTLDRTINIDTDAGEYVSMNNMDTGRTLRLEGLSVLNNIESGWYLMTVASKPLSSHPSAIKTIMELKDIPGIPGEDPKLIFNLNESRYVQRLGVDYVPRKYVEKVKLLNETKRYGSDEFSSAIDDGKLRFIVPDSGYNVVPVDRETGGKERVSIVVNYFPTNLFKDDVHSRMNLKIDLENTEQTGTTLTSPSIEDIDFTVKYI